MNQRKLLWLGLCVLGGLAANCISAANSVYSLAEPEKSLADKEPIRIGVSNAQSGPAQYLGQSLIQGSQDYFDWVNQHGGVHGQKIVIVLKDDRYEPDPAVQNTNDLITKDKVFFLFDYVGTPTLRRVLPLLKYYESENMVNVAPFTGADPQRLPPYDKYVFNIRASYREEAKALVGYLYAKGCRRFGFLGQADAYGMSGELGVTQALAELRLKPVEIARYRRNETFDTDMTAQVNILRSAGADCVVAMSVYGPAAAFIRDARMAGWNVPIANVSFLGSKFLLTTLTSASQKIGKDLTRDLINSQVVPSIEDDGYPLVAEYRQHVTPSDYSFISFEGWLNAAVVTEALRRAGPSPSREDFIHAMESLHGWDPGLEARLDFSPTNHQGLHQVWLTVARDGGWLPERGPGNQP